MGFEGIGLFRTRVHATATRVRTRRLASVATVGVAALCVLSTTVFPRASAVVPATRAGDAAPATTPGHDRLGDDDANRAGNRPSRPGAPKRCPDDPYPCGDEWPEGLEGEFGLAAVHSVKIPSHDGVMLDAWVASPSVPAGTRTPAIVTVSPYLDQFQVQQATWYDNPSTGGALGVKELGTFWSDPPVLSALLLSSGLAPIRLINSGYTLVYVSVRGTGGSGGCFELGGRNEQLDAKAVVDWIAAQPWSNRRVGMSGLSYMSWSTWSAAVEAPKALKAILTAGDLIDFFQFVYGPQAAAGPYYEHSLTALAANASVIGGSMSTRTDYLAHATCTEFTKYTTREGLSLGAERNAAFWEERSLARRLPAVRAAVLDTAGYREVSAHGFQDSTIWGSLDPKTPMVQLRGYWGHDFPRPGNAWATKFNLPSGDTSWEDIVTQWFDYWLKGIGPEPRTGVVYHQDQKLTWHESAGWSPAPSKKEVLYLSDSGLSTDPEVASTWFRAAPPPADHAFVQRGAKEMGVDISSDPGHADGLKFSLCPGSEALNVSRTYATPVTSKTLIAGNPFVDLFIKSDMAAGMVTAELYDIGPSFTCTGPDATDARWIATGSADLSFYADPFRASPFPIDRLTEVRIDLNDITHVLEPGHRLVLVLSHGEAAERKGPAAFPTITVDGSSELIVPVAEGSLGGRAPVRTYPPRPFTPPGYTD